MTSQLSRSVRQPILSGIRICKASSSRQGFATSSSRHLEETPPTSNTSSIQQTQTQITPARNVGDKDSAGKIQSFRLNQLPEYNDWIGADGKKFENTPRGRGPFWISDTPFPLNPSFDPAPPIAQSQKKALWKLHQSDPANTIRVLSGKYGIAMEQLRAILRLQALEMEWTNKGKALQEPFQQGMERILGAVERRQGASLDEQVATEAKLSSPRAATFEQFPMTSTSQQDDASILAKALKAESLERGERRRTIPTGGPASKGPRPTVTNIQGSSGRASITVVDLSKRPTSYVGGGVVARNQHRAELRKKRLTRVAEGKRRQPEEGRLEKSAQVT